MSVRYKLLLPGSARRQSLGLLWLGLVLLGGCLIGLVSAWRGPTYQAEADRALARVFLVMALFPLAGAGLCALLAWREKRRGTQLAHAVEGLRPRPPLSPRERAALAGLPLIRLAASCPLSTSSWVLQGDLDGATLWLFDAGYSGRLGSPQEPGRKCRRVQTVAVLAAAGPGFGLRRSPRPVEWDHLCPAWPGLLGLTQRRELPDCVIDVEAGACADDTLAGLGDLVIECAGHTVLLYRSGQVLSAEELPALLDVARRVRGAIATIPRQEVLASSSPVSRGGATSPGRSAFDVWLFGRRPLPGETPARWGCAVPLLCLGCLGATIGVAAVVKELRDYAILAAILVGSFLVMPSLFLAMAVGLWWGEQRLRGYWMARAGRSCGLLPRDRLTPVEWDALAGLPLFGVARRSAVSASAWVLQGAAGGREVRVFDLGYQVPSHDDDSPPPDAVAVQTVAVVSAPGLDLLFPYTAGGKPGQHLPANGFTKEGLDVERSSGLLLVYRHRRTVRPADLGAFLATVWRIAEMMRPHEDLP